MAHDIFKSPKKFSAKQIKAIELFAIGNLTHRKIAELVGVSHSTLSIWRARKEFMDAIVLRARELIRESLPELYYSAIKEAKKGKHAYFKTLIEHIDRLEGMQNTVTQGLMSFTWKARDDK